MKVNEKGDAMSASPSSVGETKVCRACTKRVVVAKFPVNKENRDGLHSYCYPCIAWRQKIARLRLKYGLSLEGYSNLMKVQEGRCAICQRTPEEAHPKLPRWLAVDHCHETGRIRGLLCTDCNTSIGKFNDDPARLRRAAEYLELAA